MDVFELRDRLVRDYSAYVESFIKIREPEIKKRVDASLNDGLLWPDPLIQLNPSFGPGESIDELVQAGTNGLFTITLHYGSTLSAPKEHLDAGNLRGAIDALTQEIKSNPTDPSRRNGPSSTVTAAPPSVPVNPLTASPSRPSSR